MAVLQLENSAWMNGRTQQTQLKHSVRFYPWGAKNCGEPITCRMKREDERSSAWYIVFPLSHVPSLALSLSHSSLCQRRMKGEEGWGEGGESRGPWPKSSSRWLCLFSSRRTTPATCNRGETQIIVLKQRFSSVSALHEPSEIYERSESLNAFFYRCFVTKKYWHAQPSLFWVRC